MESNRLTISFIGLLLFIVPGFTFLIIEISNELGQFNPFIMIILFLIGGIISLIGFITFLIAENRLKRKIITVLAGVAFYVLLLPMIWGINGLKERIYIYKHGENLENIANDILTNKISIEDANRTLEKKNSVLKVICVPDENTHVIFLLNGMIDNCFGFSYSLTNEKPSKNCCGDLTSWKKIKDNWYKWTTT